MVIKNPIGSMYGIYANIWGILIVNVTIYSIHGSYGFVFCVLATIKERMWRVLGVQYFVSPCFPRRYRSQSENRIVFFGSPLVSE
jgi:hypothetical protein